MTPTDSLRHRILIADDQADVLEALRLLLKGEGWELVTVASPAGILDAIEHREFDVVLMDLNYARDTTSGREGLDLVTRLQAVDAAPPIVVMTAWGFRGHRGRGDAPRGAGFRPEALGQRAPPGDRPHAGRTVAGIAPRAATRGREPCASRAGPHEPHRPGARHAARAADDRARRPVGCQRARDGREWHRQGRGRGSPPRRLDAGHASDGDGERGRPVGGCVLSLIHI